MLANSQSIVVECVTDRTIRNLSFNHRILHELAILHASAFPGFFLTKMGARFIREYYRSVLMYEHGILIIASNGGGLVGLAAGFVEPRGFYRFLRRRAWHFLLPSVEAMMRRPGILVHLFHGIWRTTSNSNQNSSSPQTCELASLAVSPGASGQGLGRTLVESFCLAAEKMAATRIELTTDSFDNERVNRFYQSIGFVPTTCDTRGGGRIMQHYSLNISPNRSRPST